MKPVTLTVIYRGAKPRVDKTFNLSFDTQELTSDEIAELHKSYMDECRITVATLGDTTTTLEIAPEYHKTNPARPKTPSQALRQEMWSYWNAGNFDGNFDEFYEKSIDELVRHWHDKRMDLQS